MKNEYLSDEELLKLIADVEENSLIQAPKRLKSYIFSKIEAKRNRAKMVSMTTYRLKVCVAMAAAIGIFCILPFEMPSSTDRVIKASEYREKKYTAYALKQAESDRKALQWRETKEEGKEIIENIIEAVKNNDIIGRIK